MKGLVRDVLLILVQDLGCMWLGAALAGGLVVLHVVELDVVVH